VDTTVIVALISSGGSVLTAITALLLNYRGFTSIDRRIERLEDDIKLLTGKVYEIDNRITRMEERLGIK
jgi:hypothetical protein